MYDILALVQGGYVQPEWIYLIFIFAFGGCIGSFLNVVIYRLPRDKSLVTPPSSCPACGKRIHFYDNIPLLSWLLLAGKCRYCKERISPRYFVVEFLTALLFVAIFVLYFIVEIRQFGLKTPTGIDTVLAGGWLFYLLHIALLSALLAASAIDLELWVIPLSVCWFATAVAFFASAIAGFVIDPAIIHAFRLFPVASASSGALAVGTVLGLGVSAVLLATGIVKRSYLSEMPETAGAENDTDEEEYFNHRLEMLREVVFLLPPIICACGALCIMKYVPGAKEWWIDLLQIPAISGFLGSLWGYFIGCGIVWATRILGTLAFGKEAMGLGDVHLMGAAGAVIGPWLVVMAFLIAPFFGLLWAGYQMFFKKTRQIPYGPFLSIAVFCVMIFHDWFIDYLTNMYLYR